MEMENTSGQGASAVVPDEIKGWNWGAFLMNWVWAIGNQVSLLLWLFPVIGLLTMFPYIILPMAIVLGAKGNEYAWRKRRWESVEHFRIVQRIWAYWGVAFLIVGIIVAVVIISGT